MDAYQREQETNFRAIQSMIGQLPNESDFEEKIVRVAGAQIPVTKDLEYNKKEIFKALDWAKENEVDQLLTPEAALSGYCNQWYNKLEEINSLLKEVEFDFAYMFFYSERPKTLAERKYEDDVPLKIKKSRLQEVIDLQHIHSKKKNKQAIGNIYEVLIEGKSKKSEEMLSGRNDQNTKVVFPKEQAKIGEFVNVKIENCTTATLIGKII